MKIVSEASPITMSLVGHFLLVACVGVGIWIGSHRKQFDNIDVLIFENPKVKSSSVEVSKPMVPKISKSETPKKVFGVSRRAVVDTSLQSDVNVKMGNSVAIAPDRQVLKESDPDSLPIPTDDFLVSKMPKVKTRIKIAYPPEAKNRGISGSVVMNLLIDANGRVREALLIRGPGYGLNESALEAIKQFVFSPAEVDGKPVAVRTQFTYEFILED